MLQTGEPQGLWGHQFVVWTLRSEHDELACPDPLPAPQSWGSPTVWRRCVPTSQCWSGSWPTLGGWLSRGPATRRCHTSLRSRCPCCAVTCPAGGSAGPRHPHPPGLPGPPHPAQPSPPTTSTRCWGTSCESSSTTWALTRPPG